MEFDLTPKSLLYIFSFVQGLIIAAVLIFRPKRNRANVILGLFILVFTLPSLGLLLETYHLSSIHPRAMFIPYFFFIPPALLNIYVFHLLKRENELKYTFLLLPTVFELAFLLTMMVQPMHRIMAFKGPTGLISAGIYSLLVDVFGIYIGARILYVTRNHKRATENSYSKTRPKLLGWLRKITLAFLLLYSSQLVISAFLATGILKQYNFIIDAVVSTAFVYWITISSILNKEIPELATRQPVSLTQLGTKTGTGSNDLDILINRIIENKLFMNPDLTINQLAGSMGWSIKKASTAINAGTGKNFNRLINELRVEKAKELLADQKLDHITIEAIGYEVGFNSRSVFNAHFSRLTGCSPGNFRSRHRKKELLLS